MSDDEILEIGEELAKQPHDAYFKDFFSDQGHAISFFQGHLPEKVARLVRWETLAVVPGSFVGTDLKQTHSDLLFTIETTGDRALMLYLVFEHQSRVDKSMPVRLLGYQYEILQDHFEKHGSPLPPVVCYVLHQGPEEWTVTQRFEDLFEIPEGEQQALLEYLPKFRYALLDLSQADPGKEEGDAQLRIGLQLMKLAREKQTIAFFQWLNEVFGDRCDSFPEHFIEKALLYAYCTDDTLDVETVYRSFEGSPKTQKKAMSFAEKLIEQGKAEGENRGVLLGKVQLLEEMVGVGVDSKASLAEMDVAGLEVRFRELEAVYKERFR